MKPLYGHTSEDSSYLVDSYPYGRKLRCRIRYWIEKGSGNKGFRFCSQTEDPKRLIWNNPKKGTYSLLAECMYLDENNHVKASCVTQYTPAEEVFKFITQFPETDLSILDTWCKMKVKHLALRIEGKIRWTMNGEAKPDSEEEKHRLSEEREEWKKCNLLLIGIANERKLELNGTNSQP